MKKFVIKMLSVFLSVIMLVSCCSILTMSVSAADYRSGAQSGPSVSYAGGRYYRNYLRVPITGDNRTDLIAVALSQLGYQEGASNGAFSGEVSGGSNYVEFSYNMGDLGLGYGGSDYPWCASFVSWCLYQSRCTNHATHSTLCRNHSGDYNYIWKEISCAMWVNQLKGAGYFSYSAGMGGSYTPKYGDLVFFKSSSSPSHIGICLYVKDGVLYTVEGNTSDASGLETNGGGVYFKSYSLASSYLYGYGRLPYVSNSAVTKIDYSGANPTPGLYVANAAKYIYSSEYSTSAITTIPRFSMFEITKVGANNRLYGAFTDVNGNTVTGWVENNSSRIIQLSSSGVMSGSWEYDGTGFRYKYSDGTYASAGWLQDPENMAWYYIGANGYAQSGWLYLSTGTFYLDPNSNAMLTGHRFIDGRWYYFNNDGYLCDGAWEFDGVGYRYRYVDGTYGANCWLDDATNNYVRYYLDANGYSVRGWQKIGDAWYYFDPNSGALLSGWLNIDNKWYYTDSSGAMQTGWVEEDGHYFYFDSSGARVENTTVNINGSTCTFDKNGVLVEGSVIEDTQTPNVGGGYSSYQGGMPADGTGVVQAHGIDISKWNNGDDWTTLKLNLAAVKAAGIDFVIIRCGSTNKGKDPMFEMYYNECKRLGLDVGAYFYSYALDAAGAVSDAQKCLSYIEGKQFEYPIYMDYEDPTQENLSNAKATEICTAFLDTVAAGGYLTGVYTYKSWFERGWIDSSGIRSKYEGWVTYPLTSQDHSKYDAQFSQSYGMYQYTFEYVIANAGTFDANVCYKDYPTIVKTYGFNNYAATETPNLGASWVQDDNGLRYQYSDGSYAGAGWLWDEANSAWYYLDANGYAVSGWVEDGGKKYYLDPNSNAMLTGHRYIDGNWYYFDSSGALVTNGMWYQDENGFKYQMGDGTFVYSGWIDEPISGARYYLDANGYAVSGFQTIDGTLYYFFTDSHALFRDGWVTVDGKVYRGAADGAILKGFQYVDGKYFYFDESTGAMQTGFVTFGNKWYYFSTEDGTMVTGWFTSPKTGYIYYFNDEGEMTTGWAEVDGSWYFFEDNMDNHYGQMLTGWVVSSTSGYTYYLAEDGKMVTGWQTIDDNTYYFDGNDEVYTGRMVTGEFDIEGTTYIFDDNGVLLDTYTVTFVGFEGAVIETQTIVSGEDAVAPEAPFVEGYTFTGWDKNFTNITEDTVVTALYSKDIVYYTVIFVDYDGEVISTQTIAEGEAAEAPADPSREGYTFAGWSANFDNIQKDTIIVAFYENAPENYTVTFVDFDGRVISTQTIEAGESAQAPEAPSRGADVEYIYTFTGWDKDFTNVTSDITVKAQYDTTEQVYYLRGGFNNWSTSDAMTKGENGIYTAVFTLEAGTYEYKAANENYSMEWPLGTNQTLSLSEKSVVTFTLDTVNHTLTASAEAVVVKYNVSFVDYNGNVLSTQTVAAGESAQAPSDPSRDGYLFKGWSASFDNIQGDMIIVAQYEKNEEPVKEKYIVVFVDDEGRFISSQSVEAGSSAIAPTAPAKDGYTFKGWDKEFTNITADTTIKALYEKIETEEPEKPDTPVAPSTTGRLTVEVAGGTGFNISVNNGSSKPQGTSYKNTKAPVGATVTVVAKTTNGNEFLGWMNGEGLILTTDLTYTFTTTGNDFLKAMYQTDIEEAVLVIFKNDKANQILDMQYYVEGDEVIFPDLPNNSAYDATGWSLSAEEIASAITKGESITVTPTWQRKFIYVNVSVVGGTAKGLADGKTLRFSAVTATANTAPQGQKFAYWKDQNGNVLSYSTVYMFYPAEDMVVTAVYVDENEAIDYDIVLSINMDTSNESPDTNAVILSWEVPEGAGVTFKQAGALLVDESKYNADTFYKGTTDANVTKWTPGSANQKTANAVTVNKKGVANGSTWILRAWLTYETNGEQVTIYSDLVYVVK